MSELFDLILCTAYTFLVVWCEHVQSVGQPRPCMPLLVKVLSATI